jgi:hypothetical protein
VSLDVGLGGFTRMVRRVVVMSVGYMGVMRCLLVIAAFVMLGSFPVMTGGLLMMISGLRVMLCCFFRHSLLLIG